MSLNHLDYLILIAINQGNGDTVSALSKSLAADESSIEAHISTLEKEGFVSGSQDAINKSGTVELTEKGRELLIENDMYRSFRIVQ